MTLSKNQFDIIEKMSDRSGCNCWFSIQQDENGNDYVFDLEENERLPLSIGIKTLCEGCNYDEVLSREEMNVLLELLLQLIVF